MSMMRIEAQAQWTGHSILYISGTNGHSFPYCARRQRAPLPGMRHGARRWTLQVTTVLTLAAAFNGLKYDSVQKVCEPYEVQNDHHVGIQHAYESMRCAGQTPNTPC